MPGARSGVLIRLHPPLAKQNTTHHHMTKQPARRQGSPPRTRERVFSLARALACRPDLARALPTNGLIVERHLLARPGRGVNPHAAAATVPTSSPAAAAAVATSEATATATAAIAAAKATATATAAEAAAATTAAVTPAEAATAATTAAEAAAATAAVAALHVDVHLDVAARNLRAVVLAGLVLQGRKDKAQQVRRSEAEICTAPVTSCPHT